MSGTYQYRPLRASEIRLLKIHRHSDSEIDCSLQHVHLAPFDRDSSDRPRSRKLKYYALSYTWGPSGATRTITVDGQPLLVTENLWLALRRTLLRTLWVDAVCINQADVAERNAQVQRMADIYAAARCTVVSLSETTPDTKIVLKLIRHLSLYLLSRFDAGWIEDLLAPNGPETRVKLSKFFERWQSLFDRRHTLWPSVSNFLETPWFRRLWVIQEVVLATQVWFQIGGHYRHGWSLSFAFKAILVHTAVQPSLLSSPDARAALVAIVHVSRAASQRYLSTRAPRSWRLFRHAESEEDHMRRVFDQQLEVLIARSLSSKATDPRDRVFGLLGLPLPEARCRSLVDYNVQTPAEVYVKLARFCLEDSKSPKILSLAGTEIHGRQWSTMVPSWVPDLNQASMHGSAPQSINDEAWLGDLSAFGCRISGDVLIVPGFLLAIVAQVVPPLGNDDLALDRWLQTCGTLANRCEERMLAEGDTFNSALGRTLLWATNPKQDVCFWRDHIETHSTADDAHHKTKKLTSGEKAKKSLSADAHITRFYSIDYQTRKAMMVTACGWLASGPLATQPGDTVCLIKGACVAFMLRPRVGTTRYRLVGECYVYGLMNVLRSGGDLEDIEIQ